MHMSGGAVFLLVLTALVCGTFLITAALYYMRLPIPICGRWLYAHEHAFGSMPPPPPPPDETYNYNYAAQQKQAAGMGGMRVEGV